MAPFIFASTGATLAAKALKLATRKPGTRSGPDGGILHQLGMATATPVDASVRAGLDTACWAFNGRTHQIALGDRFHTAIDGKPPRVSSPSGLDKHALLYAEQLLRHEAWHGRVTERDLPAVAQRCRDAGVPFGLLNLFEDARIEARARSVEARDFGWWRFTTTGTRTTDPTKYLWQLVNREGRPTKHDLPAADADFVRGCYDEACKAADTWQVIDIAAKWVKRFATSTVDGALPRVEGAIGGDDDGSVTREAKADAPSNEAANISDGSSEPGRLGEGREGKARTSTKRVPWQFYAEADNYGRREPVNTIAASRLAQKLAEVVAASVSPKTARVASSGSRLHIPGVAVGSAQSFRVAGKTGGKPKLTFVFDMSGSMGHDWDEHGKLFLAAVLRLVRRGTIDATVWLTGSGRHALVPSDLTDDQLAGLLPCKDNESVAVTLDAIRSTVEQSHATVIYTDGRLTDGAVDAGLWRARGVELIGAVVIPAGAYNAASIRSDMIKHFGRSVTGTTGYDLATKLAQYAAVHMTKTRSVA